MNNQVSAAEQSQDMLSFEAFASQVISDYSIALQSRETSLLGRKEVLTGKAKFGIFGDGKEVAQVAMARFFKKGDFRSGYYRDQTFMMATGNLTVKQFFAQLYADTNIEHEPCSAGRLMNGHFATHWMDNNGNWLPLTELKNVSADISPTAGQMPRGLGLAFASKIFRNVPELSGETNLSRNGNEVSFVTIGDASTSEGHFWETINAAGVLQVPLAVFVWDDGYGISVPKKYQTTKGSISEVLKGFAPDGNGTGVDIYKVKGWDYAGMCEVFEAALAKVRTTHTPALFHVEELTQPQGHSTSGSHERYKSQERLAWEKEWDGIAQMRSWMLDNGIITEESLTALENSIREDVKAQKQAAWEAYITPIKQMVAKAVAALQSVVVNDIEVYQQIQQMANDLNAIKEPLKRDVLRTLAMVLDLLPEASPTYQELHQLYEHFKQEQAKAYNTYLYHTGAKSALNVPEVKPVFNDKAPQINGFEVLNKYFDQLFASNPKVLAFGEDVGFIGDVNQGFSGLQDKYGVHRISDTGIRELTIAGQGIGAAMRGLRPITEIQYLDYLLYALQPLSDDVATLHYRTAGKQSCPIIIRTRGHRLEGVWHSVSQMGTIINSVRGFYLCVPRNMTQAVVMYNTLLRSNDPGIIIECLNGYRLKEQAPENLLDFTVPLGISEVLQEGTDITVVSYGSTLRIVQDAAQRLAKQGISVEIVDVQTLLPFDVNNGILASLKKTNRILFVDEDVPGGAAAYMFTDVMERQGGYRWLDVAPRTLTAKAHRPAYGSDGDYFSKPNAEDVIAVVKAMMAE
ncbi:MAG: thiamine pyrophosphate-dependent enzyme [Chitinophagaceae bacterium]